MIELEQLKRDYRSKTSWTSRTGWISWFMSFFIKSTLDQALSNNQIPAGPVQAWKNTLDFCKAFASMHWSVQWVFGSLLSSIGQFRDSTLYQQYQLLSPRLRNSSSAHLYFYMLNQAENPEEMVGLLRQFENKLGSFQILTSFLESLIPLLDKKDPEKRKLYINILLNSEQLPSLLDPLKHARPSFIALFFVQLQHLICLKSNFQPTLLDEVTLLQADYYDKAALRENYLVEFGLNCQALQMVGEAKEEEKEEVKDQATEVQPTELLDFLSKIKQHAYQQAYPRNTHASFLAPVVRGLLRGLLQHPDPQVATQDFIRDNQHFILAARPHRHEITKEWIASIQTLHQEGVLDYEPLSTWLASYSHHAPLILYYLSSYKDSYASKKDLWDMIVLFVKKFHCATNPVKAIEAFKPLSSCMAKDLEFFATLASHGRHVEESIVILIENGILATQSMQEYVKWLSLNKPKQSFHLAYFLPTLTVFHRLGWLNGEKRLSVALLHALNCSGSYHNPIRRLLETLYEAWEKKSLEKDFLPLFEPKAFCAFLEEVRKLTSDEALIRKIACLHMAYKSERDSDIIFRDPRFYNPLKKLQNSGLNTQMFAPEALPQEVLVSGQNASTLLQQAFVFLHKIAKTQDEHLEKRSKVQKQWDYAFRKNGVLTWALIEVLASHKVPEQALEAFALEHEVLFSLGINKTNAQEPSDGRSSSEPYSRFHYDSLYWPQWVKRVNLLIKAKALPWLSEHISTEVHNLLHGDLLTHFIELLDQLKLLEALCLPNSKTFLSSLMLKQMTDNECNNWIATREALIQLHEQSILTCDNFFTLAYVFLQGDRYDTSSNVSLLTNTLIAMREIFSTDSIKEYLAYEPFLSKTCNWDRRKTLLLFCPFLGQLYQVGLLSGEGRLTAPELLALNSYNPNSPLLQRIWWSFCDSEESSKARYLSIIPRLLQSRMTVVWDLPKSEAQEEEKDEARAVKLPVPLESYQNKLIFDILKPEPSATPSTLMRIQVGGRLGYFPDFLDRILQIGASFPADLLLQFNNNSVLPFLLKNENYEQSLYESLSTHFATLPLGLGIEFHNEEVEEERIKMQKEIQKLCQLHFEVTTFVYLQALSGITPLDNMTHALILSYLRSWEKEPSPAEIKEILLSAPQRDGFFARRVREVAPTIILGENHLSSG